MARSAIAMPAAPKCVAWGAVGGLVGSNYDQHGDGTNTISRSTASAAVDVEGGSADSVSFGGLVGYNNGPISDSHASGSVQALTQSGGLVGYNDGSGLITDSSASGDVGDAASTGQSVGGLVGLNKGGTIRGSNATGDVTSTNFTIGGLVGRNEGTITESAASGTVTGDGSVGGLVGYDRSVSSRDSISASRASGNVTGSGECRRRARGVVRGNDQGQLRDRNRKRHRGAWGEVGGLVGRLGGAIITSYASGDVSGSGDAVGGLVGQSVRANIAHPDRKQCARQLRHGQRERRRHQPGWIDRFGPGALPAHMPARASPIATGTRSGRANRSGLALTTLTPTARSTAARQRHPA